MMMMPKAVAVLPRRNGLPAGSTNGVKSAMSDSGQIRSGLRCCKMVAARALALNGMSAALPRQATEERHRGRSEKGHEPTLVR